MKYAESENWVEQVNNKFSKDMALRAVIAAMSTLSYHADEYGIEIFIDVLKEFKKRKEDFGYSEVCELARKHIDYQDNISHIIEFMYTFCAKLFSPTFKYLTLKEVDDSIEFLTALLQVDDYRFSEDFGESKFKE